jgi:ATP-dependent protease ClpP protease subunit
MLKLDRTGNVPQLYLYGLVAKPSWWTDDEIISAADVLGLLATIDPGSELSVRINSDGGDVFEGIAIYNALAGRKARVEVHVDALAASIASVIAMAGDEIIVAGNAMLMVHSAWTLADGNADELTKIAETLRKVDDTIRATYAARVGDRATPEQIAEWVAAETWMSASEAVERGFADRVGDLKTGAQAAIKPGRFRNTPKHLLAQPDKGTTRNNARHLPQIAARIAAARARNR